MGESRCNMLPLGGGRPSKRRLGIGSTSLSRERFEKCPFRVRRFGSWGVAFGDLRESGVLIDSCAGFASWFGGLHWLRLRFSYNRGRDLFRCGPGS